MFSSSPILYERYSPTPITKESCNLTANVPARENSTKPGRRMNRLTNYLEGKGKASYTLKPDLEDSLISADSSLTSEETESSNCKRGCAEILKRLADVFSSEERHNASTYASRINSYPNPKREDMAYKNLTGKCLHACSCT